MGIRKYKPTTPGRRGSSVADFTEVTRSTPEKSLVRPLHNKGGRNSSGKITCQVLRDGKVIIENTASGPGASASCTGDIDGK